MRTQICDINMFTPTPELTSIVAENKVLKMNNSKLKYILTGVAIAGAIGLVLYLRKQYLEGLDEKKVK